MSNKWRTLTLLLIAEVAAMSLWFLSAAILPAMLAEVSITPLRQAALSSAVQIGFVFGAVLSAVAGIADRYDPRRVFFACAFAAGIINAGLLIAAPGSDAAIVIRFATGALLAGVYPVGMKIVVGWGKDDRGMLVGALVGALTLGSALPHLIALGGGSDWRISVFVVSAAACASGIICLFVTLGPFHATAPRFDPRAITQAWTNRRIRLAYAGYLGHMWELYAMWAWIGVAAAASYRLNVPAERAETLATVTAFLAIGGGAILCAWAGNIADRIGKETVALWAMIVSGTAAVATAVSFGGPVWVTFLCIVVWGLSIIPDSAQFSALVADASQPDQAGSLMTLQTALGFALTFFTVQLTPILAGQFGWPLILAAMALGPVFGSVAMIRLKRLNSQNAA